MSIAERAIPDFATEWSFAFKTGVIVAGAALLLTSSLIRPNYPMLWIPIFLVGALVEWFIVTTVYVEINDIEDETKQAQLEIQKATIEIEQTQNDIQDAKEEIESTKEDVFSFISDSHGIGPTDSLEDRVGDIEDAIEIQSVGIAQKSIDERVSDLEDELESMNRDGGKF
jgi:hypothetical protein